MAKRPSLDIVATEVPPSKSESTSLDEKSASPTSASMSSDSGKRPVPLSFKIASIVLVSMIGFGGNWSSGITGAMKTKLKKGLKINNTEFALLDASEDFMKTALVLVSGIVTDRIGGAQAILYGNVIYTIGSILAAAATTVRSYRFLIFGQVVLALGDIATQVAQYKIFSSWFPPGHGFASTLAFELAIGKIGSFVGKSTSNIIAENLGDFSWVYWIAVAMNVFTNVITLVFYFFTKYCENRFLDMSDPATGEVLTEKNKKFDLKRIAELPWTFWMVMLFSLVETSGVSVFSANATELAELRFDVDSITAGWYTSVLQYAGFFLVPLIGIFIDLYGNRLTLMVFTGVLLMAAMCLVNWSVTPQGTAAAFGLYAVAFCFGPTLIIDSIRTSIWSQSVFGSAYGLKVTMNNAQNIIIRVMTGVLQDSSPKSNPYKKVTPVYLFLAICSFVVAVVLFGVYLVSKRGSGGVYIDVARLQWTRKQRTANGERMVERRKEVGFDSLEEKNARVDAGTGVVGEEEVVSEKVQRERRRMMVISRGACGVLALWVMGAWAAYFWGVATGNNN
ncbi:related to MFS transporter [Rhynchosporium graminicola]|uniref:Lysosomal dipeptide transporter MFSD1 n=1 Tax=Rhynchosporium graminicola TaxID=2792576 RepID=A0A1E1LDC7_9HELO|nr:related to MFS transporter [Rhynchosporium commune]